MLTEITAKFQEGINRAGDFPNKLKFDFGPDGRIFIDGPAKKVTNEDGAAQCTISVPLADFIQMAEGKADATMMFMQGKLKIAGDMSVAMKLKPLMEAAQGA